jgi:hypothetical protein
MHIEQVEIFSDATNAAVMRHPERVFPGFLIQGDTLSNLCKQADRMCDNIGQQADAYEEADDLRNTLYAYLNHYRAILVEHGMKLPFYD